jgi:hypothetical protein
MPLTSRNGSNAVVTAGVGFAMVKWSKTRKEMPSSVFTVS